MTSKAPLADCDNCPLKSRPCVPTKHVRNASLLVVGEAPGTSELIDRVPFIGAAGQVLDHALQYSGIDPRRVAKTNAVLCRPFGKDDPPDEAILACKPRLAADIARSGVKHVIAAGSVAAASIDLIAGNRVVGGILARAGTTYTAANGDFKYTATVNPAYLLYSDEYAPNFIRHVQRSIEDRAPSFNIDDVRFAVMTPDNKSRIIQYLASFDRGSSMAFDVETDHLQWYDTPDVPAAELLCLVITLEKWRSVIIPADMLNDPAVRDIVEICLLEYRTITHNGIFDANVMAARTGIVVDIADDTMLAHYALYELGSHGLKELGKEYLGAPDYEGELVDRWFETNKIAKDKRRYSMLPKADLYKYAAIDGVITYQLDELFIAELKRKGLYQQPYREVLIDALAYALPHISQNGIGVDREQLREAKKEFETDLAELRAKMTALVLPLLGTDQDQSAGELARLMRPKRKADAPAFNPSSPPQVHHVLYNLFGLKLTKRLIKPTKTNTGKEALEALPDHPFVHLLRKYRRIEKMLTTYIASLQRRADVFDLIHVDFKPTGTEIGRLSAANSDHGIPRADDYYGAMIRSSFVTLDEDEVFIIADYSQAELRAFAHLAQVKFLIDKYAAGEDVHTETALMLEKVGAPIFAGFHEAHTILQNAHMCTKEAVNYAKTTVKRLRVLAKNINFGNIYQGGASGISGMIGGAVPASVVAEVLKVYHSIMPEAAEYAASQFAYLRQYGYVKTVFGRQRRVYVITDNNAADYRKAAVHMVVAGSAADLNNVSSARLVRAGVRVCHLVHDSIIARAKRDEAPHVAELMQHTMINVGDQIMPSIPWIVDIDVNSDGTYPRRWVPKPKREDFIKAAA